MSGGPWLGDAITTSDGVSPIAVTPKSLVLNSKLLSPTISTFRNPCLCRSRANSGGGSSPSFVVMIMSRLFDSGFLTWPPNIFFNLTSQTDWCRYALSRSAQQFRFGSSTLNQEKSHSRFGPSSGRNLSDILLMHCN